MIERALFLLFAGICGFAQRQSPSGEWPCGGNAHLLADKNGAAVWIGFGELRQHAINAPLPKTPAPFRTSAHLIVDVLIDTDGRVKCVRVLTGHPSLKLAAAQAATEWTFKPFFAGEHPVAVLGHLEFTFGP